MFQKSAVQFGADSGDAAEKMRRSRIVRMMTCDDRPGSQEESRVRRLLQKLNEGADFGTTLALDYSEDPTSAEKTAENVAYGSGIGVG